MHVHNTHYFIWTCAYCNVNSIPALLAFYFLTNWLIGNLRKISELAISYCTKLLNNIRLHTSATKCYWCYWYLQPILRNVHFLLRFDIHQVNINHINYHKPIKFTINFIFVFIQITINWILQIPLTLQIVATAVYSKLCMWCCQWLPLGPLHALGVSKPLS